MNAKLLSANNIQVSWHTFLITVSFYPLAANETDMDTDFDDLDPDAFEELVAEIWKGMGWNTKITKSARDSGIDVVATRQNNRKEKTLIQVKRQKKPLGAPKVREYAGLYQQEKNIDNVVIVATGGFTKPAVEVANKSDVDIIDSNKLKEIREENKNTDKKIREIKTTEEKVLENIIYEALHFAKNMPRIMLRMLSTTIILVNAQLARALSMDWAVGPVAIIWVIVLTCVGVWDIANLIKDSDPPHKIGIWKQMQ